MLDSSIIILNGLNYLRDLGFHWPEGWVEACVGWLAEERKEELMSAPISKWFHYIQQQWLFTDLRELETESELSQRLKEGNNMIKYTFTGKVCLQVMSFEDISKSFYKQLVDASGSGKNDFDEESDGKKESSCNRTLQLHLSDGINSIRGFEFSPWNNVKTTSLNCGCKCRLQGPFLVRNGVALLKENNITIIGGEVEEIKKMDEVETFNELLRLNEMKLPGAPKLGSIRTNSRAIKREPKIESRPYGRSLLDETNLPKSLEKVNLGAPLKKERILPKFDDKGSFGAPEKIEASLHSTAVNEEDTHFPRKLFETSTLTRPLVNEEFETNISQETIVDFDDDDDDALFKAYEEIKDNENDEAAPVMKDTEERRTLDVNMTQMEGDQGSLGIPRERGDEGDVIHRENMGFRKEKDEEVDIQGPCTSLLDIFTEVSESDSIITKQYRVKALITTFLSKLSTTAVIQGPGHPKWTLQLRICDGTSSLDCQLSDEFMTSRIGFSASRFHEMKQTESIDRLKAVISDFQKEVVRCNCGIFTLQLSDTSDMIEVVDYTEIDEQAVLTLKEVVSRM